MRFLKRALAMNKGCVHIYYGNGKGKTTCGVGLCVRAAGAGWKVLVYQFLKDSTSSERKILKQLPQVTLLEGMEKVKFTFNMTPEELDQARIYYTQAFKKIVKMTCEGGYQMVFLDELLHMIRLELIEEKLVTDFLERRPDGVEVIMTGYDPSPRLLEMADYVSKITKEKHPFDSKLPARRGIEF